MPRPVKGNIHTDPRSGKAVVVPDHTDKRNPAVPGTPTSTRPRKLRVDEDAVAAVIAEARGEKPPARKPSAKPKRRRPVKKVKPEEKPLGVQLLNRVNRLLTTGQARIAKKDGMYVVSSKKGTATRFTTGGAFKTLDAAHRFIIDDFNLREARLGRGYTDVGVKAGGARKDATNVRRQFLENPSLATFRALEAVNPPAAALLAKKAKLWPTPSLAQLKATGKPSDWAFATLVVRSLIPKEPEDKSVVGRDGYAVIIEYLRDMCYGKDSGEAVFDAFRATFGIMGMSVKLRDDYYDRPLKRAVLEYVRDRSPLTPEQEKALESIDITRLARFAHCNEKDGIAKVWGKDGYEWSSAFSNVAKREWESPEAFEGRIAGSLRAYGLAWDDLKDAMRNGGEEREPPTQRPRPRGARVKPKDDERELTEAERMALWERTVPKEYERKGGRAGKARRPQDFLTQFGLGGMEFGAWVDDAKGRDHVERCGEALQDMADALGIADRAVGLNGRLLLSFGARGHSGAVGHYEPNNGLIALTRDKGAGSMGHEWGHFLDHVLWRIHVGDTARPDPRKKTHVVAKTLKYATEMLALAKPGMDADGNRITNPVLLQVQRVMHVVLGGVPVREFKGDPTRYKKGEDWVGSAEQYLTRAWGDPEAAFDAYLKDRNVVQDEKTTQGILDYIAMRTGWGGPRDVDMSQWKGRESQFLKSMAEMDKGKRKKYWTMPQEMFARALEAHITDKLAAKRRSNNYLVRNEKSAGTSPLPQDETERKAISREFDELFRIITEEGTLQKGHQFLQALQKALE